MGLGVGSGEPAGRHQVTAIRGCTTPHRKARNLMNVFHLIMLVFAFVFFVLAALNIGPPRLSLGWLGMAFLTLALWLPPQR
jgi:hypothetical protein